MQKVWTAALFDAEQGYPYLKRFPLEASARHQNFLGENPDSRLLLLTDTAYPRLVVTYAAPDDFREPLTIDAEEFIGQKSFKAKGKRITTLNVEKIEEIENPDAPSTPPVAEETETPEEETNEANEIEETNAPENSDDSEDSGDSHATHGPSIQLNLFDD